MDVRIFQPAKTAMQSGRVRTQAWVLEFVIDEAKRIDGLMGWTGSADTRHQVQLRFATKDEAIAYARRQNHRYTVDEAHDRLVRPKSYAENFTRRV
ncbi:MAG: oxidoreductase [Alphaproteobacteria bacterium]|nr:oxidoreductase [Alphaproteobacteria bacterium]